MAGLPTPGHGTQAEKLRHHVVAQPNSTASKALSFHLARSTWRKLALKVGELRYKVIRAGICCRPYRCLHSATAGLDASIRRMLMGRAAREWLGRHGWELFLIVAAAVVGDVVDHLW